MSYSGIIRVPTGEHSALGPSSSERWINCPGSVKASEGYADEESIFAAEGSAAHYMAEICYYSGVPATYYLGATIKVGKHEFVFDDEFAESVQEFNDWCAEAPGHELAEIRVDYEKWVPGGFGTLDRAKLDDGTCFVRDYKHGKGVQVYAEGNTQLMLYALGIYVAYSWLYDFKEFELGICQPRLDHKDTWTISVKRLLDWADNVLPAAYIQVQHGLVFKPGSWCKFCRRRYDCPVRAAAALETLGFTDLDAPAPAEKAPEQRAKILASLEWIKAWIKDFEKAAVADLIAGKKIGDWKIVEGRSNRVWNAEETEILNALLLRGAKQEDCYTKEFISPAAAEKIVGKKKLDHLIRKPPGKPKLAPGSDKREAMTNASIEDFTNLDEE